MKNKFKQTITAYILFSIFNLLPQTSAKILFENATPESQGISSANLDSLFSRIEMYYDNSEIIGGELMIIKNNEIIFNKVIGYKDKESNEKLEINSIYNIRSMTKTLTGASIQILIDEGKISLSDKVYRYLPGFDNDKCREITIEHLLTHRSGLPLSGLKSSDYYYNYKTLIEYANDIGKNGIEFSVDSIFWYSDAGCEVLGAIIEVVSKMTLDNFFKENIIKPLNMKNATVLIGEDYEPNSRFLPLYVVTSNGFQKIWKPGDKSFYPFAWGSQSVFMTCSDYAVFLSLWLNDGEFLGERVLSKEAVQRILTPVSYMNSLGSDTEMPTEFPDVKVYYGQLAIIWSKNMALENALAYGHSGSDGTFAWAFPKQNIIVLYFTQSRGQASGIKFEKEIYHFLINKNYSEIDSIPENFKQLLGEYCLYSIEEGLKSFKIVIKNSKLAIDIPKQMIVELSEPNVKGTRFLKLAPNVLVDFNNNNGKIESITMTEIINFTKNDVADSSYKSYPSNFNDYYGKYSLRAMNQIFEVFYHNNNLAVKTPQQKIFHLIKASENGLWKELETKNNFYTFDTNNTGAIISFNLLVTTQVFKGKILASKMEDLILNGNSENALKLYNERKNHPELRYNEENINTLGYRLLKSNKVNEAIKIFILNTEAYPESPNTFDSLGEAYLKAGDKEKSIKYYEKVLELSPNNANALKMLEKIKKME